VRKRFWGLFTQTREKADPTRCFFPRKFLQPATAIFDMCTMAQSTQVQREGVAHVAGRILIALRNGESTDLIQELEHARWMAAQTPLSSTLEMEAMEVLSGAVDSLGHLWGRHAGAVRLLEHLASRAPRETGL
jgi:hypothetical protein